ncbi:MAG: Crp/Fnr family transcriptional regulator, partial [Aeromonas sobria]
RFGTTERVYRRALKELIEQGIVCEGAEGPAIADLARLRTYLDL